MLLTETAAETSHAPTKEQSASGGPPDHLSKKEVHANALGKPKWGKQNEEPLAARGEDQTRDYAALNTLMAQYSTWLNYDAAQDAEEAARAKAINSIFDGVNQERAQLMDERFGVLEDNGKQMARQDAEKWGGDREASAEAIDNNAKARAGNGFEQASRGGLWSETGLGAELGKGPLEGDLSPTGFSAGAQGASVWSYDESDLSSKLWDSEAPMDLESMQSAPVKGYQVFEDEKKQKVSVPQLGWGRSKPSVYRWTIEEKETWWAHVEGTAAKQRSGSSGQNVWNNGGGGLGTVVSSTLHGGRHMMGKQGKAEATGWDCYIQHDKVQPDGDRSDLRHPESALKQRETQLKALKKYYEDRTAYIAKYGHFLDGE